MNVMYLSSLVEGSLNIWYNSLDAVSAVSNPVAVWDNTETQKMYKDIRVQSSENAIAVSERCNGVQTSVLYSKTYCSTVHFRRITSIS